MTNAEKYLKDNVYIEDILSDFSNMYADNELQKCILIIGLKNFLEAKANSNKSTLTEDERVILRNMKVKGSTAEYIRRVENTGYLQVYARCGVVGANFANIDIYSHLFQFIKEGEEYEIKELLGENK